MDMDRRNIVLIDVAANYYLYSHANRFLISQFFYFCFLCIRKMLISQLSLSVPFVRLSFDCASVTLDPVGMLGEG